MITEKVDLLRKFVDYICEECNRHEDKCGRLEAHRVRQGGEYSLRNVKMVCKKCHGYFSSAQRIASGSQNR